ncbi:MAG: VOC family protein [Acidobacteria bacterium]|nr:VOC family protein [Acidobacteriota bacterium]
MRKIETCFSIVLVAVGILVAYADNQKSSAQPLSQDSTSIGELFQVILNVTDMERQVKFYRDTMGFAVTLPEGRTDLGKETFVRLRTGGADLALHAGRNSKSGPDEPRLSFMTKDIRGARERILQADLPVGEIRSPAPGVLVVDCRDPEGNAFHLEARVPTGSEKEWIERRRYQ